MMQSEKLSNPSLLFLYCSKTLYKQYFYLSNYFTAISNLMVRSNDIRNNIFETVRFQLIIGTFFQELDFEVELAFVIGKTGKKIKVCYTYCYVVVNLYRPSRPLIQG